MSKEYNTVYCPDCDEDYEIVWVSEESTVCVLCDCDELEPIDEFLERFRDEFSDGGERHNRMYQ